MSISRETHRLRDQIRLENKMKVFRKYALIILSNLR